MHHNTRVRRRGIAALIAAALLALGLLAGQASAAPALQTWVGQPTGASPDILAGGLTLFGPQGDVVATGASAGTIGVALDGVPYAAFCTDIGRIFSTSPEPVETTVQDPPATPTARALTWILLNRTPTGSPTPEKQRLAAAAQVATWILVDPKINSSVPTDDAALNAAALALVQEANAATASPVSLSLSAVVPAAGATSSTITVFSRPGTLVTLSVSQGAGSLSTSDVLVGPGGFGTATVTVPGPGTVSVSASTPGDGRLIDINPTNPRTRPQPTAVAEPTTLTATTPVVFTAAPAAPVAPAPVARVAPVAPVAVPVAGVGVPKVTISKRGPTRARVLSQIDYTIVVRNPGTVTLRNVVLRDRLPRGVAFVGASRRSSLTRGVVTFRLGTLAPGQARTIIVTVVATSSVRGARVNIARVTATGARMVGARARTAFRPLVRRVQPAVAG